MIAIRPAEYRDLFAIEALLMAGIEETDVYPEPVRPLVYHQALSAIQHGLIFVAAQGERIIGAMMLHVEEWAWHPGQGFLANTHFYVLPEFRGKAVTDSHKLISEALIQAARDYADKKNLPLILRVTFKGRLEAKARLMEMQGMEYLGATFLHRKKMADPHILALPEQAAA
jgi:GNAT superfamily N-acetyltransferase